MKQGEGRKKGNGKAIGSQKSTTKTAKAPFMRTREEFHLKLKHVLGGISFLSVLAAFEVFSIPASNGIIDLLGLTNFMAGMTWMFVATLSGGAAIVLHRKEEIY